MLILLLMCKSQWRKFYIVYTKYLLFDLVNNTNFVKQRNFPKLRRNQMSRNNFEWTERIYSCGLIKIES